MEKTWASGAIELLNHADQHISQKTAFDKRIAFISIDNAIEVALRTFISLPVKKSQINFSSKEKEDIGNSFPKLVSLVFSRAESKLSGLDDSDIEHYHRIRNQLYHEGTGLSVDELYLRTYREIANVLLENLFSIKMNLSNSQDISVENLVRLWNQIQILIKQKMKTKGIDYSQTYKWELAEQEGIIDKNLTRKIAELNILRNFYVHSMDTNIDYERVPYGISLGKDILNQLK